MTSVLVSGGAGFLGSHLIDRLLTRSDLETLVAVDSFWTGRIENLEHIRDGRLRLHRGRVEDFSSDRRFDEIYHLASPATPAVYGANPAATISANVAGALRLREVLSPGGLFCYTSTSEVYGEATVTPQPESYRGAVDCTGPRASYDEAKRCTEALLFESRRVNGMRVKVVRLFNTYGPRTRENDGRAVSNFISQALRGQPITIFGDGSQTRSWGYVSDIMDGFERFFWRDGNDFAGPLNLGNDREASVLDIAEHICSLVPGSSIAFLPPAPQDPINRRPDLTLARRILPGWSCRMEYEQGIAATLAWFSEATGIRVGPAASPSA